MRMYNQEVLCGIEVVEVYKDDTNLYLKCADGGIVRISVSGDCCSTASIDKVRFDLPAKLTGDYTETTTTDDMLPTDQEVDHITAVKLGGGLHGFEHRNSSNGYYGNYWSASKVDAISESAKLLDQGRYGF